MEFFDINLQALQTQNVILYEKLKNIKEIKTYEIFMKDGDLSSLNLIHKEYFSPLYKDEPSSQNDETLKGFQKYETYPYLYFFGFGNGFVLNELLKNPKRDSIVVIEPEIEILYIVLHLLDLHVELEKKRLIIFDFESLLFQNLTDYFSNENVLRYSKLYDLHVMTPFYDKFSKEIKAVNDLMMEAIYHNVQLIGNDAEDSLIGVEHHFMNVPFMLKTPTFLSFLEKIKTTDVAVLVSTGPSLTKQIPLLKEIAPYVRIFSVDASFPVLYKHGIKPDVVVSMERVTLTKKFFQNTPKEAYEGVTFILSSLQHPEVVNSIKGGTVVMSMRPFGYMEKTGATTWGYVGLGFSGAYAAYEMIFYSKFKTCILIGQDLAFGEDGLSHADGHALGRDDVKAKITDSYVTKYGGEGEVKTSAIWRMFLSCFEKDIQSTKGVMETINATEGGARIGAAIELPFKEAVELRVKRTREKKGIALKPLDKTKLKIVTKEVNKNIQKIKDFLKKQQSDAEYILLKLSEVCKEDETEQISLDKLLEIYKEIQNFRKRLEDKLFIDVVWFVGKSMLFGKELKLATLEVKYTQNQKEERENLKEILLTYKEWFFGLAGCINAMRLAMERKGEHYEKAEK